MARLIHQWQARSSAKRLRFMSNKTTLALTLALALFVLPVRAVTVYGETDAPTAPDTGPLITSESERVMLPLIYAGGNGSPQASNDSYHTFEDEDLTVDAANGVLVNDADPEADPLAAVLVRDVANGNLKLNDDGAFDYTPDLNFHGQDSFTYRASDGVDVSHTAVVTLTITGVNDAPAAVQDVYQTPADTALTVNATAGVLANDADPELDPLQAVLVGDVVHGVLTLEMDGSFDYLPNAGSNQQDSFTYQASDGVATSNTVTVTLTIAANNNPPAAADDADYQTPEDAVLIVDAASGILANDSDPDEDTLQATLLGDVAYGMLNLNLNGSFDYTPAPDFNGQDSFTYRASDGVATSNPATVTLTVSAVNDPPLAIADGYQTAEDVTLTKSAADGLLANDSDPDEDALQVTLLSDVAHGELILNPDGSFDYTPNPNFSGEDSFSYQASDGVATSDAVVVTLTINGVNDAPVAGNDSYNAPRDKVLMISAAAGVLINDSDPESDPLQATLVGDVSHGLLQLNANGSFSYTPDPGFNGQDSFTYRASDGSLTSNLATATFTVAGNNAPKIVTGEIAFTKQVIDDTVGRAHAVLGADLDGDDDIDIVATDTDDHTIFWYENQGNGVFVTKVVDDNLTHAYPASLGDVNRDGYTDVLAAGYTADTFVWYQNDGAGNFTRHDIDTASDGAHSIVAVDLDKDNDIDFVTSSQDANTIAWYENDGAYNFTEHVVDNTATDAKRAEFADIDGDGNLDIVTASTGIHEVAWYKNDGNQNFTKRTIRKWVIGAYYASPADINGNGKIDVFSASQWDHMIQWHENDGAGNFTQHIIDDNAQGARTVIPADIDQDGDVDALAASVNDDTIAWHRNDGSGNFTKKTIDSSADGAYFVFAIDMDHDRDVDVLSASRDANAVAIHTQIRAHASTVGFGGTLLIDSSLLHTEDVDDGPAGLTYILITSPNFGQVRLNGEPVAASVGFTQDDVNNDRVTYVHDGVSGFIDGFSFTVADGGENGVAPATGTFEISVAGLAASRVEPSP